MYCFEHTSPIWDVMSNAVNICVLYWVDFRCWLQKVLEIAFCNSQYFSKECSSAFDCTKDYIREVSEGKTRWRVGIVHTVFFYGCIKLKVKSDSKIFSFEMPVKFPFHAPCFRLDVLCNILVSMSGPELVMAI